MGLWVFFRDAYFCAIFTFSLNTAAYQAEILAGAIRAVPSGQWQAADSLGLRPFTTMFKVILPQALITALRPYGNEVILMIKGSAIASIITVLDLMGQTRYAFSKTYDLQIYIWAAIYLITVEVLRRLWGNDGAPAHPPSPSDRAPRRQKAPGRKRQGPSGCSERFTNLEVVGGESRPGWISGRPCDRGGRSDRRRCSLRGAPWRSDGRAADAADGSADNGSLAAAGNGADRRAAERADGSARGHALLGGRLVGTGAEPECQHGNCDSENFHDCLQN